MSNCLSFNTQIASIMEVLANAAVAEICKLVNDGCAVLQLEISRYQKENEHLKRKLLVLESRKEQVCEVKRAEAERWPSGNSRSVGFQVSEPQNGAMDDVDRSCGSNVNVCTWENREVTPPDGHRLPILNTKEQNSQVTPQIQAIRAEEEAPKSVWIKEEMLESDLEVRDQEDKVNIIGDHTMQIPTDERLRPGSRACGSSREVLYEQLPTGTTAGTSGWEPMSSYRDVTPDVKSSTEWSDFGSNYYETSQETMYKPRTQRTASGSWEPPEHYKYAEASSGAGMIFQNGLSGTIPSSEFHILKMMDTLRQQQVQLEASVNQVLSLLQEDHSKDLAEMPPEFIYPLMGIRDLNCHEAWLSDPINANAKAKMVTYLGSIGGGHLRATVCNILSAVLSNSLARQINWKGVNGKTAFKSLHVKSLIIRAVKKNAKGKLASQKDVERIIIRWLNLAGDRDGGRRQRELAKQPSQT